MADWESPPATDNSFKKSVKDFDRRRATALVLKDATQRLLSPGEIRQLHEAVLKSDMSLKDKRPLAFAIIKKNAYGRVLTYDEAKAVADAINVLWLNKPISDGFGSGVRDSRRGTCNCVCLGDGKCPECKSCSFLIDKTGGYARNSLSSPPSYAHVDIDPSVDCGCGK